MAITDNLTRFKQLQGQLQRPTGSLLADADTTSSSIANLDAQRQQMMSAISRAYNAKLEEEQANTQESQYDSTGKTVEQMYAETGRQSDLDMAKSSGFDFNQPMDQSAQLQQGSILPNKVQITQAFGNYNPGLEPNKSGRNWGVDFGVKEGTPLALPPGEWEVMQTYNQSQGKGRVGNRENSGYGNSVLVRNPKTGETMRFSHLSGVNVQPGKTYAGGTVLGKSGATGNVTGPHLDLEYKNAQGQYKDILRSPYARSLFGMGGGSSSNGTGGGLDLKSISSKIGEIYKSAFPSAPLNQFNNTMEMAQSGVTPETMTPEQKQGMVDSSMGFAMGISNPVRRLPARVNLIEKGLANNPNKAMQAIENLYKTHTKELGKKATNYLVKNIPSELDRINTMLADLKGLL